jgi:hypothetical protein
MRKRAITSSAHTFSKYHVDCPISYSSDSWKRYTNEKAEGHAHYIIMQSRPAQHTAHPRIFFGP